MGKSRLGIALGAMVVVWGTGCPGDEDETGPPCIFEALTSENNRVTVCYEAKGITPEECDAAQPASLGDRTQWDESHSSCAKHFQGTSTEGQCEGTAHLYVEGIRFGSYGEEKVDQELAAEYCAAAIEALGLDDDSGGNGGNGGGKSSCGDDELTRGTGTDGSEQLFCSDIDTPPTGVFISQDTCIELSADGTGRIDWGGGYSPTTRFVGEGWTRQDDIEEFEWGALLAEDGSYLMDPAQGGLQIFWHEPGSDTPVEPQVPFLVWDEDSMSFLNMWPAYYADPPAEMVTSAACMFSEPRCLTLTTQEVCYADGLMDGPYKRFDENGNTIEEGEYSMGERTGTWTFTTYENGVAESREERMFEGSDETYSYEKYLGDTLIEEGQLVDGQRDGAFRFYFEPDEPGASQPDNAAGLLREEGSYSLGMEVSVWTTYKVLYDIDLPTDYQEVDAYYQNRVGIDVCVAVEQDRGTGVIKSYSYGDSSCGSNTCNGGLSSIKTASPGTDPSCVDGGGAPTGCSSIICK